jgi:hypothetical protein
LSGATDAESGKGRSSKNQIDENTRVKSASVVSNSPPKKEQNTLELANLDSKSYKSFRSYKSRALSNKNVSKGYIE